MGGDRAGDRAHEPTLCQIKGARLKQPKQTWRKITINDDVTYRYTYYLPIASPSLPMIRLDDHGPFLPFLRLLFFNIFFSREWG